MNMERPRFSVTVSQELYDEVNKYQHGRRLSTQTKAIVELLEIGLSALLDKDVALAPTVSPALQELFGMIEQLDLEDRAEIKGEVRQMLKSDKYRKYPTSKNA